MRPAVGRKIPIWRFRSVKLRNNPFLRPLRGGVDNPCYRRERAATSVSLEETYTMALTSFIIPRGVSASPLAWRDYEKPS
jgi:hypothetical protein